MTYRLQLQAADSFALFTSRMAEWWPLVTHSVGEEEAVDVTLEPRLGGHIVETTSDGAKHTWGTITEWDPGHRVSFTWHPGQDEEVATLVEVRVRDVDGGSELMLVHAGWEVRGDKALGLRNAYQNGWDIVLGQFTAAA